MRAMHCVLGAAVLAAAAASHTAPAPAPANKWTHMGHDARNSSANPAEMAITAANFASLVQTGPHDVPVGTRTRPVTQNQDGTLYGCDTDGVTVFALDGATGAQIWRRSDLPGARCGGVVAGRASLWVTSGRSVTGVGDDLVMQLDRANAHLLWQVAFTDLSSQGMVSPVVSGDLLLAAQERDAVHALDASTGAHRWTVKTCYANFPPAVADGRVFVSGNYSSCREAPSLYAFDAATGALLWQRVINPGGGSQRGATDTPVVVGNQVIVATDNSAIYASDQVKAFDAVTGALNWVSPVAVGWEVKMAATSTEVVAATGYTIHGIDLASGALNWTVTIDTGEFVTSTLAVTGTGVFFTVGTGLSPYDKDSRLAMISHTGAKRLLRHPQGGMNPGYGLEASAANGRVQLTNKYSGKIYLLTPPSP